MRQGKRRTAPIGGAIAAIAALLCLLPAAAAASHDHHKVYVFSIDGLDPEALGQGASPNIDRLVAGGAGANTTFFENSRSVMFAETNPNHTAMITGAYGNRSGITSNEYAVYQEIADEDSCPEPGAAVTTEPNATAGESSACLQVPTIMETLLRRKHAKHITTALIMGKPKLAKLFATRNVDPDRYDADHIWAPCGSSPADYCEDVPTQPVTNYSAADSYPMDEVIRTVRDGVEDEGRPRRPDYTFVNLPQVDSAGHVFGRNSAAYTTALRLADVEIGRFVDNQKELGIWDRTIMMIVSDHSMLDTPFPTKVRIEDTLDAAGVPSGSYEVVANAGSQAHIYLTDRSDPRRDPLLKQMRDALVAVPGVDAAYYRRPNSADGGKTLTVRKAERDWRLWGRRAGDIVLTTVAGVGVYETSEASSAPFNPFTGGHGNAASAENTFLITGGHPAIKQKTAKVDAPNVDLAATVMRLMNRKPPKSNQGDFRKQAFRVKLLERPKNR